MHTFLSLLLYSLFKERNQPIYSEKPHVVRLSLDKTMALSITVNCIVFNQWKLGEGTFGLTNGIYALFSLLKKGNE